MAKATTIDETKTTGERPTKLQAFTRASDMLCLLPTAEAERVLSALWEMYASEMHASVPMRTENW